MNNKGRQLLFPTSPTRPSELVRHSGSPSFAIIRLPSRVRRQMVADIIVKFNGKAVTTTVNKKLNAVIYPKFKSLATSPKLKFRVPGNHQSVKEMNGKLDR